MRRALGLLALVSLAPLAPLSAQTHLVVITGLSGEAGYADAFHAWATTLIDAARERWGLPESNIVYLAEDAARAPDRIADRSTRENVGRELRDLAARASPGDLVLVVLIGHGSTREDEARFNLPGPDITAAEFDALLGALSNQRVAFINAASASGDFIAALSKPDRAVVTATRNGRERNETMFGRFFVEAFAGDDADVDKDGRVSLLEAFNFARREVERAYERDGRLLTEHALLDDNGDAVGSGDPDPANGDGALAQAMYLAAGPTPGATATADSLLRRLYGEKRALEEKVAALRARKAEMDPEAYERELEGLLVELALKNREIREAEGTQ